MHPHTRAMVAASAHTIISGKKVAGIYDHAAGNDLRIAAECRGNRLQGLDGDRSVKFGGTLPELYDEGDNVFVTLDVDGAKARGYDRGSGGFYEAIVSEALVQLYDHGEGVWYSYDIRVA